MKIQPIDKDSKTVGESVRTDSVKPVPKSLLRRLFDRQVPSVLKTSSSEDTTADETAHFTSRDSTSENEPSSYLEKQVNRFFEGSNEKQPPPTTAGKCIRNRCNCFNVTSNDSSDDEADTSGDSGESTASACSSGDTCENLKSLIPCLSSFERNLLVDAANLVEKNSRIIKQKDDLRKIVVDGLSSVCYDSSVCKSKWDKSPSIPSGTYEYIDVIAEGERFIVDIDFRSEFEIARPTGPYKTILQLIPTIFVGRSDRLGQIVSIVSEAAKSSLKKKGMLLPPWRKSEYMRAKWLSPPTRIYKPITPEVAEENDSEIQVEIEAPVDGELVAGENVSGDFELSFGVAKPPTERSPHLDRSCPPANPDENEKKSEIFPVWEPPAIKPRSAAKGAKIVTGLASLLTETP